MRQPELHTRRRHLNTQKKKTEKKRFVDNLHTAAAVLQFTHTHTCIRVRLRKNTHTENKGSQCRVFLKLIGQAFFFLCLFFFFLRYTSVKDTSSLNRSILSHHFSFGVLFMFHTRTHTYIHIYIYIYIYMYTTEYIFNGNRQRATINGKQTDERTERGEKKKLARSR